MRTVRVPNLGLYSGGRGADKSLFDWNTICVWVNLEMVARRRTEEEALGIFESVIREVFARRHRRWIYSIHLLEGELYFYRWDRSGTIVSKGSSCGKTQDCSCGCCGGSPR